MFGCDICQMVCPWNRKITQESVDPAFKAHPEYLALDLIQETKLDQAAFSYKFRGSPIKRAKRRGYLRNIVTVLANYSSQQVILTLTKLLLEEPEALVRAHAVWSLAQISDALAKESLLLAAKHEQDEMVLEEIYQALQEIND